MMMTRCAVPLRRVGRGIAHRRGRRRGPPGAANAIPAGPSTAGPGGLDVRIASGPFSSGQSTASCPADHPFSVGGGYEEFSTSSGPMGPVIASFPIGGGWVADLAPGFGDQIEAYAVCAN